MSRYILNEVETSHHLILIRLYFILRILITEDDHNHIVFDWIKIIACMIALIVTRKRGDGRYYFTLWQTNNNTPNKLVLSESAVSCLLRVRSVSFTSRAVNLMHFRVYWTKTRFLWISNWWTTLTWLRIR
jgi:hypothetical protein